MKLPVYDVLRYFRIYHVSGSWVHVGVLLCRFGMDLHNKLLMLLFPNAYVKFQVVCGRLQEIFGGFEWFWMVSGGFGWFRMGSGGFGWFQVVCCFSSYRLLFTSSTSARFFYKQRFISTQPQCCVTFS